MRKHLPKIALVVLILIVALMYVFAQTNSFDYYRQNSELNWEILIFTQNDNLYPALKFVENASRGNILIVDTVTNDVYVLDQWAGRGWEFLVYKEVPGSRQQFKLMDCLGGANEWQVPDEKTQTSSTIKLSDITAECFNFNSDKIFPLSDLEVDLQVYGSNIRQAYKLLYPDLALDAVTLEGVIVPSDVEALTLTPSTFKQQSTKKTEYSFELPAANYDGYSLFITANKAKNPDDFDAELEFFRKDPKWRDKLVLLLKVSDSVDKGTISGEISKPAELAILNNTDREPGKYIVLAMTHNKAATYAGAFLEIKPKDGTGPTSTCSTVLECLAEIDKKFVEDIFK